MVLISETEGRTDGASGYGRLVGNVAVGEALSKAHAATIRGGMRLVEAVARNVHPRGAFVRQETLWRYATWGTMFPIDHPIVAVHCAVPPPADFDPHAPKKVDMLVWEQGDQRLTVCAITEADQWDTKKSDGEEEALSKAAREFDRRLPTAAGRSCRYRMVSFHADETGAVAAGFKHRFHRDMLMTGREFCRWIGSDFGAVAAEMDRDRARNLDTLVRSLADVPEVASILRAAGWRLEGDLS